jgi:hypothetical protein
MLKYLEMQKWCIPLLILYSYVNIGLRIIFTCISLTNCGSGLTHFLQILEPLWLSLIMYWWRTLLRMIGRQLIFGRRVEGMGIWRRQFCIFSLWCLKRIIKVGHLVTSSILGVIHKHFYLCSLSLLHILSLLIRFILDKVFHLGRIK